MTPRRLTSMLRPLTRRPGTRRSVGYTLIEIVIATLVAAALTIGVLRWLVGVGGVVQTNLADTRQGNLLVAVDQLDRDLRALGTCTTTGVDAPVRVVADDTLVIVTDPEGDGTRVFVAWRFADGAMQRQVVTATGCTTPTPGEEWVTIVGGIDDNGRFDLIRDGVRVAAGTDGTCEHPFNDRCTVPAIRVSVAYDGDPAAVTRVFRLP